MKRTWIKIRTSAAAIARRVPTEGQELLGLALLTIGLWLWSPALALSVLGALLLASALLSDAAGTHRNKE